MVHSYRLLHVRKDNKYWNSYDALKSRKIHDTILYYCLVKYHNTEVYCVALPLSIFISVSSYREN